MRMDINTKPKQELSFKCLENISWASPLITTAQVLQPGAILDPSVKATTIPMNVPFAKADLSNHVLQMYPYTWQDQFNLHDKGGTPVDMCLLLLSLKAVEHACGQERSKKPNASCDEKALHSEKKGMKRPGTEK